jgi:TRAP-type mannitol/chloroaromatic compound transport system permease large subunit
MMVPFINGWTSLVESSAIGAMAAFLAAVLKGRMTREVFENSVRNTLGISCMFMWIILAALAFGAVFDGLGAVKAIENLFTEKLGLEPWMILVLMQLSFILMGTFLDDTAMLVIVAPLYVPLVGALGYDLIWYGVLYTITTQIAYMTPPFGYNLFLMRAMAPPEIGLRDIYRSIIAVCRGDDAGLDTGDAVSANCALAAPLCLRAVTQWRGQGEDVVSF